MKPQISQKCHEVRDCHSLRLRNDRRRGLIPRNDFVLWFVLVLSFSRVISAEEISAYSFKSDGEWYQEYCWLNGSGETYGRWTFTDLNKKEVKKGLEVEITLLVIKVSKGGKETETSADVLVSVGKLKSRKYVSSDIRGGIREEENWDYSIVRNSRKRAKSGIPFVVKIGKSSLPKDGNFAVKIVRSGSKKKPWLGIKSDSVVVVY